MVRHRDARPPAAPAGQTATLARVDATVSRLLTSAATADDDHTALAYLDAAVKIEQQATATAAANRAVADPLVQKLLARATQALNAGDTPRAEALLQAARAAATRTRFGALRIRRQVVPFTVLGLLWAGATVGQLGAGAGAGRILAGLYLALAVVWWWARGRRADWTDRPRRWRRRYTTVVAVSGAAWLWWACAGGAIGWQAAVLWAGGYTLAVPYWAAHRIPDPPAEIAPEPPAPPAMVVDRRPRTVALWESRVATRIAPGAKLTDWQDSPGGQVAEAYIVRLPPGEMTRADLQSKVSAIASALELGLADIRIDRHPDDREHLARLLILDRAEGAADMTYPGPEAAFDPATGTAYIGRYPDGELLPWQVFSPSWGAFSGLFLGSTGCGKSRLIELLCLTLLRTGMVEIWMADPQGGASLPVLADNANWVATDPDEINLMMRGVDIVGRYRQKYISAHKYPVHTISRERPMLFVVIDECHDVLFGKEHPNTKIGERVAAMYRKCGIGMLLASQMTELSVFGGSDKIRSNILRSNAFIMQIASKIAPHLLAGLTGNPATLRLPGQGFKIPSTRDISARSWRPLDDDAETQPILRAAYAALPPRPGLETGVVGALGGLFAGRHLRRLAARASAVAELAQYDPAIFTELNETDPELAAAAFAVHLAVPAGGPTQPAGLWTPGPQLPASRGGQPSAFRVTSTGVTLQPAAWTRIGQEELEPTKESPERAASVRQADHPQLSLAGQEIYSLIPADSTIGTGDIIARATCSTQHVHKMLAALARDGLVIQPRHGQWTRAA
ncbi:hypothetical protein [Frankia sp. Cas4]|uniref:hypothetical protein n=1 Tax=Frankia sp. Cas4 TaxID=3073927 RepID=UPI002AD22866|nr:hypothetical protein [Frankia sp. Cas4]